MLLLISANLFPRRESRGEGPAFDYEANAVKERICGSSGLQRVQGSELGLLGGEEGGVVSELTRGGESSVMSGDRERLRPGVSHFSFNDFIAVAFPDLARDLDIQI